MGNCSWQNRDILKADILPFYYQTVETMASNELEFPQESHAGGRKRMTFDASERQSLSLRKRFHTP